MNHKKSLTGNANQAFWRIGFRPFFSLGSLFAMGIIVYWLMALSGYFGLMVTSLWHAHEMLYGFGSAILAGFLLTALQNWSGERGLHGQKLQALVILWLLGRFAAVFSNHFLGNDLVFAVIDLSFFPAVLYFAHPYLKPQKRQHLFYGILGLFIIANGLYHYSDETARNGIYLALHLYLLLSVFIGGRVIPAFTRNSLNGISLHSVKVLEKGVLAVSILWLGVESLRFWLPNLETVAAGLALLAAGLHSLRWIAWKPWKSLHKPLLMVLPLAYFWMLIGLALRGLWGYNTIVTHFFAVGVMGGLMHGMMTRVALGHTGRPLNASGLTITGYICLQFALLSRTIGIVFWPELYLTLLYLTGGAWCLAFALYTVEYLPILLQARPDGRTDS